jgi:hypothetical protein
MLKKWGTPNFRLLCEQGKTLAGSFPIFGCVINIYTVYIYIYTRILKAFQNMSCTTRTTPQNNLLPDIEFNVVDREGHGP